MSTSSGVIRDDSYYQSVGAETVPAVLVDGVPTSWVRHVYTMRVRERETEYRGYGSHSTAFSGVNSGDALTMVTSGSNFSYAGYERKVGRRMVNAAGFWRVTAWERWQALYQDGTRINGAASARFTDTTPASSI